MTCTRFAAALACALVLAAAPAAQAQDAPPGCAEAAAQLAGQWQERTGARPFSMEIAPGAHACTLGVLVHWPQSLAARHFWQFTARWDAASGSFAYAAGRHWREAAMAPEDQAPRQDVKYENGSGALRLDGDALLWNERKEGICKECRFRKVAPAVADADVPAVPDALALVAAQDIAHVLRVIGTDGESFHIVFSAVQRSADDPLRYTVTGKTQTGSGEQRQERAFTGMLEVQSASLLPRTPANAERYKGYPDGVTLGSMEAHTELAVGRGQQGGGAIEGVLRVAVLHGADGTIVPDRALHASGDSRPDHRLLAQGGYASGEFTGTWTPQGGASAPLTFAAFSF